MNDTMVCKKCGWQCRRVEQQWTEGPDGTLIELPEAMFSPHPTEGCNSPFYVGQALYWDLDQSDPDMPPLRVFFKEIHEYESAIFALKDGVWVKESEARPIVVSVEVDMSAVFPQHEEIYGRELLEKPITIHVGSLTPEEVWPVIEVA